MSAVYEINTNFMIEINSNFSDGDRRLSSMSTDYRTSTITLSTSFFLSVRALQKMIDLFYGGIFFQKKIENSFSGDSRVDVECRETRELLMKARALGSASEDMSFAKVGLVYFLNNLTFFYLEKMKKFLNMNKIFSSKFRNFQSSEVFAPEEGALTSSVHRSSFHSNLSSGKDSRHQSETNKRSVKTRQSGYLFSILIESRNL